MNDAPPWLSKTLLSGALLGACLNLLSSLRVRGPRHAALLFALGTGLPAAGELLATGPLGLLRHRTRPRVAGVPVAVLLGWYCAIQGSITVAGRLLGRLPLDDDARRRALPPLAALVGTSLDLVVDPAGLDAGLWEWNADGVYAKAVEGVNGRRGVPASNFLGWLLLVWGVARLYGGVEPRGDGQPTDGRLPALLLLPYYLTAVVWAAGRRRLRYLAYSIPFPVALYAALSKR